MTKHMSNFTHLIPCAICPRETTAIHLGSVRFIHKAKFHKGVYGIPPDKEAFAYRAFDELIKRKSGDWIAEVSLSSENYDQETQIELLREAHIARTTQANLLVDIAIGCLQATLAQPHLDNAHRLTSRATSVFSPGLQIQEDGAPLISIHNRQPGIAVASFGSRLYENRKTLGHMGNRLSEFSNVNSAFPKINEAWCTAAYWYHQALAEPVDTIRVIKLVTAVEILLHTVSTKGSTSKISEALTRITGLRPDEIIKDGDNGKGVTVRQLAKQIIESRSRVLHGTLPTFSSEKTNVFKDVEWLARTLLTTICQRIAEYQSSESPQDSIDAMLAHPITPLHHA